MLTERELQQIVTALCGFRNYNLNDKPFTSLDDVVRLLNSYTDSDGYYAPYTTDTHHGYRWTPPPIKLTKAVDQPLDNPTPT